MKLPEQNYYTFSDAAEKIGCSLSRLINLCNSSFICPSVHIEMLDNRCGKYIMKTPKNFDIDTYSVGNDLFYHEGAAIYKPIKKGEDDNWFHYDFTVLCGEFYVLPLSLKKREFDESINKITCAMISTHQYGGMSISATSMDDCFEFNFSNFLILKSEIDRVISISNEQEQNEIESTRTANRKGEIIPALLKMIPEFNDVDIDTMSAAKISSILETIASSKGINISIPDKGTWARYLGRK